MNFCELLCKFHNYIPNINNFCIHKFSNMRGLLENDAFKCFRVLKIKFRFLLIYLFMNINSESLFAYAFFSEKCFFFLYFR